MANLQNKRIKDTYEGLIKTNDNNAISSEVELTDGAGNGTGVSVSTDGRVVASGTVSFGSLKDTGENITITKFVDQADGIANNDNDTSIPTVAAVKDYVDSTELDTVTSVNTQTGDVVLDTDDISEGSNKYYTEARVSANTSVAANTLKNTYPSADATKVGHITITQAVDLDTLESNVATNNSKISFDSTSSTKLAGIESGAEVNPTSTDELSEGSTNLYYTDARVSANSTVAANTAKTGITTQQAADITTNNSKVGITTTQANAITTNSAKVSFPEAPNDGDSYVRKNEGWESLTHPADAVTSVNGETGVVVLDSDDITEGTSNLYFTDARVSANSDVTANTAKVGITTQQSSDITTNNAKVGITTQQATDIVTNNSKVGITTQQASDIATNNAKVGITTTQADAITANTAKVGITTDQANAITDNTAKVGITTQQASDITTNNAKVGITTQQASDITTNNAKVGITTTQANNITTNNAKISFDSTSSTKLAGIETGAEVNVNADWNATTGDAEILNKPTLFSGSYNDLTDKPTIPTNNNELINGAGYITDGNTGWDNSYGFITASSTDTLTNKSGNISQWTNDSGYTTNVGDITNVSVGTGLDGGGSSGSVTINLDLTEISVSVGLDTTATGITLDLSEFTDMTADMVETDEFIVLDNGAERRKAVNEIKSTLFSNNDLYKVIGIATDHGNRVTLDNGTSEGATSIMQNFEILIAN